MKSVPQLFLLLTYTEHRREENLEIKLNNRKNISSELTTNEQQKKTDFFTDIHCEVATPPCENIVWWLLLSLSLSPSHEKLTTVLSVSLTLLV